MSSKSGRKRRAREHAVAPPAPRVAPPSPAPAPVPTSAAALVPPTESAPVEVLVPPVMSRPEPGWTTPPPAVISLTPTPLPPPEPSPSPAEPPKIPSVAPPPVLVHPPELSPQVLAGWSQFFSALDARFERLERKVDQGAIRPDSQVRLGADVPTGPLWRRFLAGDLPGAGAPLATRRAARHRALVCTMVVLGFPILLGLALLWRAVLP